MAKKLIDMKIDEVSGVDKAANGKTFVLLKREKSAKGGEKVEKNSLKNIVNTLKKAIGAVKKDDTESKVLDFNAAMTGKQKEDENWKKESVVCDAVYALDAALESIVTSDELEDKQDAALESINQFFEFLQGTDVLKGDDDMGEQKNDETLKEVKNLLEQLMDVVSGKTTEPANKDDGGKANEPVKNDDGEEKGPEDGMSKSLKKRFEDLEKRNQELEDKIKKQKDEAEKAEFVKKAAGLDHLGINADEVGGIMKSIHDTNPECAEKLESVLKAANEQVKKGALFAENGIDGGVEESDIVKRVNTMADEACKKSAGLTHEKAVLEVLRNNPDMYKEYCSQQ